MNFKTIRIREDVYNKISEYCKLNNLKITDFCTEKLEDSIMIEQYGDTPFGKMIDNTPKPKKIETAQITTEETVTIANNAVLDVETHNTTEEQPIIRKRRL